MNIKIKIKKIRKLNYTLAFASALAAALIS
jgi:hypothetical protein